MRTYPALQPDSVDFMNSRLLIAACSILALPLLTACDTSSGPAPVAPGVDPHSFAEPGRVRIEHMDLDLNVDFDARRLGGHVILELDRLDPDYERLVLDTRDLAIQDVTGAGALPEDEFRPLSWRLAEGASRVELGRPLVIALNDATRRVRIDYASAPEAFGLQWLDGAQTDSGAPFVFSQSQPVYARTWVPVQDTPRVRYTFEATLRVPSRLMAVMGAAGNPDSRNATGVYEFEMPQPIPSYLMAFAAGDLQFAEIGPRTGVYAEPGLLQAAAAEFHQLEGMVEIGEDLYGEYRWGRYDLLVLPPSFPFGGMENPRLSFITPTIIAGDGSLLALIAHELAHSWSGNLVTNASWNHLWLNEGFTVYFEARIMEALYGEKQRDMEAVLGYQGLIDELAELDPADSKLVMELAGRNPDDAFTAVTYDMGRLFLEFLEDRFGRERFDDFLRRYFDDHAFQSLDSAAFRDYLRTELMDPNPGRVTPAEIDAWLHQPGLPDTVVVPESDAFDKVDAARERWLAGNMPVDDLPADDWSVHEWRHFLVGLEGKVRNGDLAMLDDRFALTNTGNYEILSTWLMRSVEVEYEPVRERLEAFLLEVGRNKFVRPLYQALNDSAWRDWAMDIYQRAEPGYHPMTRQAAEQALGIGDEGGGQEE